MGDVVRLVSGGFDPLHSGHISLINGAARKFEDHLDTIVALNSDDWLIRKKGNYLLPWHERVDIVKNLKGVGQVIGFDDSDDTACDAIQQIRDKWPNHLIHFHNGGDRNSPENVMEVLRFADDPLIEFHFATGGCTKLNSSSKILSNYINRHNQLTKRSWGVYDVLKDYPGSKVKTLTVNPGSNLSMQKHGFRSEHWFVAEGTATLEYQPESGVEMQLVNFQKHDLITIPVHCWHKLYNATDVPLHIVEIQYGEKCTEDDILRQSR